MPIRKIYSPALTHQRTPVAKKKYFVSYCVMDGGLGFGHASLVLSELDANPNANVRVDSAYGFYSLANTLVAKVFGFDPVSVGQLKKEDLRYFVMPDANYVYNFELTQEQMKELKARLEARMKLYNELITNAKKQMKSKGIKSKVSDMQALHYIQDNQEEFPEVKKLKPTDFKHYQVHKNNCVIQAQTMLSSIGLECKDKVTKVTQQKFMSKKATKVKDMEKVHMASIGGTTKSFFQPYSVFSLNPVRLVKNIVNKIKGTAPKGKEIEYKKWQTTTKDIESAKEQYLKKSTPDLFSKGKKLLKKYKVDSFEKLTESILEHNSKTKEQDLKDTKDILNIVQNLDNGELIKKKLLHVQAEAFWTERFTYFDSKGQACDLWSKVPQRQIELMKHYSTLIEVLKSRIRGIKPHSTENDMLISFLDAGFLALSQVSINYKKLENILENIVDFHDNLVKDELKQDILTNEERSTLQKDLAEIKSLSQKDQTQAPIKKM